MYTAGREHLPRVNKGEFLAQVTMNLEALTLTDSPRDSRRVEDVSDGRDLVIMRIP